MKNAFIFPGQASQFVGMGKDIYDEFEICRDTFDTANDIMDMDISSICFNGPEEKLKETYITQPAIFIHSVALFRILQEKGFMPSAVAGHSLGEYSALVAAGSLSFEEGLKLVKQRGALMYKAGKDKPGTMAAIIGMTPDQVYEVTSAVEGIVQPANFNSPGQVAISGEVEAVHEAMSKAKEAGAKKVQELVVSGAFHSPLMDEAQAGFREALQSARIDDAKVPLYSNVEARAITNSDVIRDLLYKQLTMPVRWQEIIEQMVGDGFEKFNEVGPGKVLRGLLKRINRQVPCQEIGTVEAIETMGNS